MQKSEDFSGKCIIISGAAGAVGDSLTKQLAQENVKLILADLPQTIKKLEGIAEEASLLGSEVFCYGIDICNMEDITAFIEKLEKDNLEVDVLVNAVGLNCPTSARFMTEPVWDEVVDTNLKGIYFLTQAIANHSLIKRQGVIVNISSQHGIVGNENRVHYCASKAGVIGMTKALACEWAKYKVRVNCVSPTFIITEKNNSYLNTPYNRQFSLHKIPLGEYALPEDVANGIIFLAGPKSRMITGHNLVIDGGYTII